MRRLPIGIGAIAFLSVVLGSIAFAIESEPISRSSVAMILIGLNGIALSGLAGLMLVRAPWSRWVLAGSVVAAGALASIGGGIWFWVVLGMGTVATIGIAGPWLTLWVRQQPAAEPLGWVPITLMASGAFTPIVVGFASHSGVGASHWTLVFVVIASAWAYGRGLPFGIWGLRVLVPISGAAAMFRTEFPGNMAIAVGALTIAVLAWTPAAKRVTAVITPPLPAPTPRRTSDDAGK